MAVETERLLLRDLEHGDLDSMVRIWTDPDVARFMDTFGPRTPAQVEVWLPEAINAREENRRYRGWAVVLKESDEVIGWIGFGPDSRGVGDIDFAYAIAGDRRGLGYGSEALRAAAECCFAELDAASFWGQCRVDNEASAGAMRRAGMSYIGTVDGQHRFLVRREAAGEWV